MRIIQAVLAALLCIYVAGDWQAGRPAFTVVEGLDVPFWLAIPLAAICAVGALADFARSRT